MTVGDLINWELQNFTPSGSTQVLCTWAETGAGTARYWGFESAAGVSYVYYGGDTNNTGNSTVSGIKLCLTNTYYFHNFAAGLGGCGIQTK